MKRLCVAVAVLLSVVACKQENGTTDTTASTDSAPTNTTAVAQTSIDVAVHFKGLVAHVLGPYQKSVVLNAANHNRDIKITGAAASQEENCKKLQGGWTAAGTCEFPINYMSLQLMDGTQKAMSGDLKAADTTFASLVPDLNEIDKTAFTDANLTPEAKGEIVDGSKISWGTFDLHGGVATSEAMPCQGRIGSGQVRRFPISTTVKYTVAGPAVLRVMTANKETVDIALQGPIVSIDINNNDDDSHQSDFDTYKNLSKLVPTLPAVRQESSQECGGGHPTPQNGVPGCHDARVSLGTH